MLHYGWKPQKLYNQISDCLIKLKNTSGACDREHNSEAVLAGGSLLSHNESLLQRHTDAAGL